MTDADVAGACVEAGIDAPAQSSHMRQLLLAHLCDVPAAAHTEHAVRFVAADDDDDDDDDNVSEDMEASGCRAQGAGSEQAALQHRLSDAMDFRHDIVCLTPPDSEGEAEEHIEALDEIDAEIVALQRRLQSFRGVGQSGARSVCHTADTDGSTDHRPEELHSTGSAPKEVKEGSSAQALLAAAGLELSPGGTSYRVIGRQVRASLPRNEPVRTSVPSFRVIGRERRISSPRRHESVRAVSIGLGLCPCIR